MKNSDLAVLRTIMFEHERAMNSLRSADVAEEHREAYRIAAFIHEDRANALRSVISGLKLVKELGHVALRGTENDQYELRGYLRTLLLLLEEEE